MRILLTITLTLFCLQATAAIYKWVDEDGNVIFGDKPPAKNTEKVKTNPINTIAPLAPPKPKEEKKEGEEGDAENGEAPQEGKKEKAPTRYKKVAIAQPENDKAFRSNNGQVTVSVESTPPLDVQAGHQLKLYMDNTEVAKGTNSSFTLENVNRGTHSLKVEIIDKKGKVLKASDGITFHLQRFSSLH